MNLEQLKYPIGDFTFPQEYNTELFKQWISEIESLPQRLLVLSQKLNDENIDWVYRPEGWTIRQVIHHLPDSHANGYTRFKLALTEDNPTIKPYLEAKWAELPDSKNDPIEDSLLMLKGIHARWTSTLRNISTEDFERTFYHPEAKQSYTLKSYLALYAWHGNHHLAHIAQALKFKGQF